MKSGNSVLDQNREESVERKLRVFIIEDNFKYQDLIEAVFLEAEHQTKALAPSSLEEAIKAIIDFGPDLVLLDHELGQDTFDGEDIAEKIRNEFPIMGISSIPRNYLSNFNWTGKEKLQRDFKLYGQSLLASALQIIDETLKR